MSLSKRATSMARMACAVAALALSAPCPAAEPGPGAAKLLVARDGIDDWRYEHGVLLLIDHGPRGASGVILNRPSDTTLATAFPQSKRLAGRADRLFEGGPIEPDSLVFLFRAKVPRAGTTQVVPGVRLGSSLRLLRELLDRRQPTEGLRIIAGLTVWAPGQLEAEIARGDLRVVPADARLLLDTRPDALWRELHARAFPPGT